MPANDELHDPRRTVNRSYDMRHHGTSELRGADCPRSRYFNSGRFGRMFRRLPPFTPHPDQLLELGKKNGPMDGALGNPDHPLRLPAGFTFLGQFIDHDITFDPTSILERQVDPEAIANFRTPALELDNVYSSGPGASPYLYSRDDSDKLLVDAAEGADVGTDVPRNREGTAVIGDPRNDENRIVNQLHLAFLRFHNAAVDRVRAENLVPPGRTVFETAQRLVRWHYQWIVLHEYLPAIAGQPVVNAALSERRFYRWDNEPFIPVEFSVAAFRFGHSQVRDGYALNENFRGAIFPNLAGGNRIKKEEVIDWRRFFQTGAPDVLQVGKQFDPRLSSALLELPFPTGAPGDPKSLAQRNLLRAVTFGLPSGQDVAQAMAEGHNEDSTKFPGLRRIAVLSPDDLPDLKPLNLQHQSPLWYYILREAEVMAEGVTLGPVGGRIVAEVIVGLLQGDKQSYLSAAPGWQPTFGNNGEFKMADLLRMAGVAPA